MTVSSETMVSGYCRPHVLAVFTLLIIIECIISLKLLELRVPAHVALGTRAALSCRWALGPADVLYSVKWYKDGKEFFRHVPRDHEPRVKFPLPGVDVEQWDSSGSSLVLSAASSSTAGRYRCEVSGERPLFPTVSGHADLDVVVLPKKGPVLFGLQSTYRLGEQVKVNCTSDRSRPSSKLSWYINGEPAPTTALLPPEHQIFRNNLESSTLGLSFIITEQHLKRNEIEVKCLATLASLYWRSVEESATLQRGNVHHDLSPPLQDPNTDADLVYSNLAQSLPCSITTIVIMLSLIFSIRLRYIKTE